MVLVSTGQPCSPVGWLALWGASPVGHLVRLSGCAGLVSAQLLSSRQFRILTAILCQTFCKELARSQWLAGEYMHAVAHTALLKGVNND